MTIFWLYLILPFTLSISLNAQTNQPQLNYSRLTTIDLPAGYSQVAMAQDYSMAIFYRKGGASPPIFYDPYSWRPLTQFLNFQGDPVFIDFYQNQQKITNVIYSNKDKQIRAKFYTNNTLKDIILFKGTICPSYFLKIAVSSDNKMWASSCDQKETVYIGKISQNSDDPLPIIYEKDCNITDFGWRANLPQLVISCYDKAETFPFFTYNVQSKSFHSLKISQSWVWRAQISPLNNILYYIEQNSIISSFYNNYNFSSGDVKSQDLGYWVDDMLLKGKFIAFLDLNGVWSIYTVDQTNLTSHNYFYQSDLLLGDRGLGPDGIYLILKPQNDSQTATEILKLCNEEGYFYDTKQHKCLTCQSPCQSCLITANSCISCNSSEYTVLATNHSCVLCNAVYQNCKQCTSEHCLNCISPYLLTKQGLCKLCPDVIPGCKLCQNTTTCLNCTAQYTLIQDKCFLCSVILPGCSTCKNESTCLVCQDSYFLQEESKCKLCSAVMEGCFKCANHSECSVCSVGFVINSYHTCSRCSVLMQGCEECIKTNICQKCSSDYELNPQTYKCELPSNNNIILIIVYIGAAIVLVITGIVIYLIWRKNSKKRRLKQLMSSSLIQKQQKQYDDPRMGEGYLIPD